MPRDPAAAQYRQILQFTQGDKVACTVESTRRYLETHPKDAVTWLWHVDALRRMARYPEALAALRRADRLCSPHFRHQVYSSFGEVYRDKGAYRLAERWFRRAADAAPSDAGRLIFLGALLAKAGRLPEAEAVHRRATRCKKGPIDEAYLNLGFVLRAQERYTEARKCFQKAIQIDPKYKHAREALADVERAIEIKRGG